MGKIIPWRKRKKEIGTDLNILLEIAVDLKAKLKDSQGDTVKDFDDFVQGKMMAILIAKRMVEVDSILCGLYVSGLLGSLFRYAPEHWVATDYVIESLEKNDPSLIQRGANVCFLIYSVLPARLGKTMKVGIYKSYGIGLYMQFYTQTDKEIGYYMSRNFTDMAEAAKLCINTI